MGLLTLGLVNGARRQAKKTKLAVQAADANNMAALMTTQRLLMEQNELLRRGLLTPEQREAEDAARLVAAEKHDLIESLMLAHQVEAARTPKTVKLASLAAYGVDFPKWTPTMELDRQLAIFRVGDLQEMDLDGLRAEDEAVG